MSATNVNLQGVSVAFDKDNPQQVAILRKLLFVSGLLIVIGTVLCTLDCEGILRIPHTVQNSIMIPMNSVVTSIFTTTLLGYCIINSSVTAPSRSGK